MPTAGGLPQRVLRMAGPQTLFAPAEGSGTETPAAEPAPALSRPWAGQPVSPDPPAAFLLAQAHLIAELKMMQSQLMISEKRLLRLSESVLQKLNKMNDAEFEDMDFFE